jgi:hypothetical protein
MGIDHKRDCFLNHTGISLVLETARISVKEKAALGSSDLIEDSLLEDQKDERGVAA